MKSIWALELIVVLFRNSDRSWSVDELSRELRANRGIVLDVVSHSPELIRDEGGSRFRYAPANPEIDGFVRDLEELYVQRPISLMKSILASPNSKIQSFADAFKFRKD